MLRYLVKYEGKLLGNFGSLTAARKRCLALRKRYPNKAPINIHVVKVKDQH
jgi:hypothetical protein